MLGRIAQQPVMPYEASRPLHEKSQWERNEREDLKTAIEYLYEFKEKLSKLHPMALEAIDMMLQRPRY
jgi:hypothetical protein